MSSLRSPRRAWPAVAAVVLLAGCAVTDPDRQLSTAQAVASKQFDAELKWLNTEDARRQAQSEVDRRLASPLAGEDAVRIALAYSPAMQALLSGRIVDSASAAQFARLPNPVFQYENLVQSAGGARDFEINRTLGFSLLELVLLPARHRLATQAQTAARIRTAGEVVRVATETRQAWVEAVSTAQVARYAGQVKASAEAGAELAGRMQARGNYSKLQKVREQVFLADAITQATRAQLAALQARERLVRLLGLDGDRAAKLVLPDRLPELPATIRPEGPVVQAGIDQRFDVQLARAELDIAARERGLTKVTGLVNGFDVGLERNTLTGGPPQRGYVLAMPLPVFDAGDAQRARAQAGYLATLNRTAQVGVDAASQLRETYAAYRAAHELARHYRDEIVPLRKAIADENLLRYNGMLIGVFELLADAREQIASVSLAFEAERDFWRADAALQAEMLGAVH